MNTYQLLQEFDRDLRVNFDLDATPDFITDFILYASDELKIKFWKDDSLCSVDWNIHDYQQRAQHPKFIVLTSSFDTKSYLDETNAYYVARLQLMDGSHTIFKAFTDVLLSPIMKERDIHPGSVIMVKDFAMVSNSTKIGTWRWQMLLKEFSVSVPYCTRNIGRTIRICRAALVNNQTYSTTIFTCRDSTEIDSPYKQAKDASLENGTWIIEDKSRKRWVVNQRYLRTPYITPYVTRNSVCCCTHKFGWDSCIYNNILPDYIDKIVLCNMNKKRCSANNLLSNIQHNQNTLEGLDRQKWGDDIENHHKRWCLYWWYHLNFFWKCKTEQLPTLELQQGIPQCIMNAIYNEFPDQSSKP